MKAIEMPIYRPAGKPIGTEGGWHELAFGPFIILIAPDPGHGLRPCFIRDPSSQPEALPYELMLHVRAAEAEAEALRWAARFDALIRTGKERG